MTKEAPLRVRNTILGKLLGTLSLMAVLSASAYATTCTMVADSTSDGPFNTVSEGGYPTVYQAQGTTGNYSGFMYFQRPSGVTFTQGATLYVEVDYLDESGNGNIGIQYDALATQGSAFEVANLGLNNSVLNTAVYKSAVFELPNAAFALDENGGNDLRLTQSVGSFQFNVIDVVVSDSPSALYQSDTAFLGPYTGSTYVGGTAVDATTILNKVLCGYQGWYGAPGDSDNVYWSHWSSNPTVFSTANLQIDPWPDMTEYTTAEQFAVPGFTNSGGAQTQLFSSDLQRTVLRHFQWMEAWGIDGVGVQRFLGSTGDGGPALPLDRVLTYAREGANLTGRTYYVEYDMTGMTEANIVPDMTADWNYLCNTLKITQDTRYLHMNGLPVVGVYGFFAARFSATTAQDILNIFSSGSNKAFVSGAGEWYWRTDAAWTAAWNTVLYQMGSWQPWNTGDSTGGSPDYASTGYWAADKAQLAANSSCIYQPQIYPGTSSNNRDGSTGAPAGLDRLSGSFLWNQFTAVYTLGQSGGVEQPQSVFLGMFDEFSEGTQIAKTTNTPPTSPSIYSITNENLPSDCWLCFTSEGAKMLKGQIAYSASAPACAGLTQPTIPDAIAPLDNASDPSGNVTFSWTAALALTYGGSLSTYQIAINGVTTTTGSLSLTDTMNLAPGTYWWRVRAENSLGNYGGWSVAQSFTVTGPTSTPTRTVTETSTPTPSATKSSTKTLSPTPSPSKTATDTRTATLTFSATESATPSLTATPSPTRSDTRTSTASPTPTPSRSSSPSVTDTRSVTDSPTTTGTKTVSPTQSPSPSPSATASYTADETPTLSPTPSLSSTQSPSLTPSPSKSATSTPTVSASPSETRTASPTKTATPTFSASPTATDTRSATPSLTPSDTKTATATASPSSSQSPSPTDTPDVTFTPSPTESLSLTQTQSFTPSPSLSASDTFTATKTPSPTKTATDTKTASPTFSASNTGTLTNTWTATKTATQTKTLTATQTATPSPSQTHSKTATATPSLSPSPSASQTESATWTPQPSASPSRSATASPTPTLSALPTPRSTRTASPSPTLLATAQPGSGAASILKTVPVPNPNPSQIAVDLSGQSVLTLQIFSEGMVLMDEVTTPPLGPGWVRIALPPSFLSNTPNGTYYYRVMLGDSPTHAAVGRLVILR